MPSTDDVHNFARRLENEHDRVRRADIPERDRDALMQFLVDKDGQIAVSSLEEYCRRIRMTATISPMPLVEYELDDYERLVYQLRHEEDLTDKTVRNRENTLCIFFKDILDKEWVDDVERISVEPKKVDPSDMLEPEDIKELISACRHQRDVALIEFLADTGARLGLVLSLRIKDLDLEGDRATYRPNSDAVGLKDAEIKPYPIVDSAATIRGYLRETHPQSENPDAALFHKFRQYDPGEAEDDGAISPTHTRNTLRRIAERSPVDKPVNPHNFRHSAITRMFREGYSRGQIQHRVQWTIDTDMWDRYVHLTAEELNEDIFATAGVADADGSKADPERRSCGQCREALAPHHEYCSRCGSAVTPAARDEVERLQEGGLEELATGDLTASERRIVAASLKAARSNNSAAGHVSPSDESSADD